MLRSVTELAERSHNVRLRLPVLSFQLVRKVLIKFRGTGAVKKHQDFEFLFHCCVVPVIPTEVEESLTISEQTDV